MKKASEAGPKRSHASRKRLSQSLSYFIVEEAPRLQISFVPILNDLAQPLPSALRHLRIWRIRNWHGRRHADTYRIHTQS